MIRVVSSLLALTLMGFIFYESSHPLGIDLNRFALQDKLVHASAYGVLAVLLLFTQQSGPGGFSLRQQWLAIGSSILYGMSDEWHQRFTPTRTPDFWDLVADGTGAIIAVLIANMLVRRLYTQANSGKLGQA